MGENVKSNLVRLRVLVVCLLLALSFAVPAYSQVGFFATVTGTVNDSSGALIPGVSIKATATETGVVTTSVTNESGSYNFNNLLPGKYTLSASLPGFQVKSITDVNLSQNASYRYNFQLSVAGVNTQVEVTVSADTILAASGATVGQVLPQEKVQELPMVGNNVLNLITVMAGVENIVPTNPPSAANAFGRENTTFAGVSAQNVAIIRDGIQVQDNRYPNGIYSATVINPDMVGEIRLILAPVDVEMGRGNGAITYSTRSGTNRYTGSAVWSIINTSLNPNSWTNNRNQTPAYPGAPAGVATRPDWSNTNEFTASFGGPIIRNKTFFFGLFNYYRNDQRTLTNSTVPTPCARLGIFRYFNGWNNGNIGTAPNLTSAATAQFASVNVDGTPINPMNNGAATPGGLPPGWGTGATAGVPYDPSLQSFSLFGALQSKPTAADCSDAPINKTTLIPNGVTPGAPGSPIAGNGSNGWDLYRKQLDPTGYISRVMGFFPSPNNYEIGDGLNTAGYRFLRHFTGLDNLFGSGEATGRRYQYNAKVDHNFSTNHKANVNVTVERVSSDDVVYSLPGAFSNKNFRNPIVISSGLTSTLSSTLLNEARFGMRRQGTNVIAPWDRPEYQDQMAAYLPQQVNGFRIIPQISALNFCYPHSGVRPPGGCAGGAITAYSVDTTPTYTYSDTLSWSRGAHAFKFGVELRKSTSEAKQGTSGFFSNYNISTTAIGGSNGTSSQTNNNVTDISSTNPTMAYLLGTSAGNARSLANYYAGSLSDITNLYFITDPNNLSQWSDYKTSPFIITKLVQNEFSTFVKDDYKITKDLTLNLGIRWDYIGVPYVNSGLTVAAVGGGDAAFGISGRDFTGWMNPGQRADLTSVQFVGPHSPNSGKTVYPNDYNNFGPAVGFAWNVPWFGEGKTTVRGGYQVTFQGGGRFNAIQGALAFPPGSTLQQGNTTNGGNLQNAYLDMTSLATAVPAPPSVLPMQAIPIDQRTQNFTTFDSHFVSPYVENLTLSITRSVARNLTMDVRYVGTFSKKNYTMLNLNTNNYINNGLLDALAAVRAGTETTKAAADPKDLLNQLFDGINLCSAGGSCTALPAGQTYGPIGTTTGSGANALYQTAALQMRSAGQFNTNLANGAFNAIASTLNTLNIPAGGGNPPALTGQGGVLRHANTLYPGQFPENFIATNPQYNAMNLNNNSGYNNYHSLEVQASVRPLHGFSGQATYTWSKNLGLPGTLTDPTNRALDYTNINNTPGQSLRMNGVIELPFGPNKLVAGNSSGWVARAIEQWQLGLIYNLNSGAPTTVTAANMLYANGVPDIVYPVDLNDLKGVRWGIRSNAFLEGRYFDNNDAFLKVADPQCNAVTNLQNLSGLVPATGAPTLRCTLQSLAMAVPAGTAGAVDRTFNDGVTRPSVIVLQNPLPGKRGTLGQNTVIGLGSYRFDANLGKTFRLTESKSLVVRFDAQNVLNHPQPGNPSLAMNSTTPWGQITAKTGGRLFQGSLRVNF
jgi:Carboxypeptidase regulatory-like domain